MTNDETRETGTFFSSASWQLKEVQLIYLYSNFRLWKSQNFIISHQHLLGSKQTLMAPLDSKPYSWLLQSYFNANVVIAKISCELTVIPKVTNLNVEICHVWRPQHLVNTNSIVNPKFKCIYFTSGFLPQSWCSLYWEYLGINGINRTKEDYY